MIGDISKGVLWIIDIKSKLKALKAAWIPRLVSYNSKPPLLKKKKNTGKTLFLKNWVNGNILYLKNLFDDNGNTCMKTSQMFYDVIKKMHNWLCKYKTLLSLSH